MVGYLNQSYLAAKLGHCFTDINSGDLGIPFVERSMDMDYRRHARGRQFALVLFARAHHQAGDAEKAATVAVEAAKVAASLKSERSRDYLRDLASRLGPMPGFPLYRCSRPS